jgi:hypothetical protein
MNSLFDSADLIPQPRYSEPVKFKHFSGVAKAVLSARDVLETPSEQPRENEFYEREWREFANENPRPTPSQIAEFRNGLSERAARERNFKAMGVYGMPQWFFIANEAEVLEKNARENERRANSEFWQNYGRKGRK